MGYLRQVVIMYPMPAISFCDKRLLHDLNYGTVMVVMILLFSCKSFRQKVG